MATKTPGVYIVEKNAFAHSVVEVPTAVPAFIGVTERADHGGRPLLNRPWRISSMADYTKAFGVAAPAVFKLEKAPVSHPMPRLPTEARGQLADFAWNGRNYRVSRAPGRAGGRFLMHLAMQHFFLNGGAACWVVSVGGYAAEIVAGDDSTGLIGGLKPLVAEQEPTLVVVPDAVLLDEPACVHVQQAVLSHCSGTMRNRIAILDVWGGDRRRDDAALGWDCIEHFRDQIGEQGLDFAAAYYPWLHTSLVQRGTALPIVIESNLIELEPPSSADVPGSLRACAHEMARGLVNLMPPSAAMAGLYTMVDSTRGVWKAPANVSVAGVLAPAVVVSHGEQEDLNVTPTGKSINAIRSFIGEGTLVWGARTLDGNSLDWRYINVRRTMIMLEQSCQFAAKALVFEPNTASTWAMLKSMLVNFLTGIWKRGGLAGAVPDDAFSVHLGAGETMTQQDVLDGLLRVTVLVAVTRPAEFIEITFEQRLQPA